MNNPEEEASVFYRNDTEEMRVHEFLATVDEGKREIKDSEKDEARHDFVDSYTEGKSFASTRQEVSASGMDFSCAEGNNAEEKYYEAGCFTVYRGRVMNYQRHDSTPRSLEEQKHRTASLLEKPLHHSPINRQKPEAIRLLVFHLCPEGDLNPHVR